MNRIQFLSIAMTLALGMSSTATQSNAQEFTVTGVSGNQIVLDRLWKQGCVPGTGGNDWTKSERTLTGLVLTTTLTDFQNGASAPDCENGRVGYAQYSQTLTADGVMVDINWVDFDGNPTSAPEGLENVTQANGATGLVSIAKVIPETQARVDQLNQFQFCGYSNWEVGTSQPSEGLVQCFSGGINPGKGTIVVDDRTTPWKVYDGISVDPSAYPTSMPAYGSHSGPFATN